MNAKPNKILTKKLVLAVNFLLAIRQIPFLNVESNQIIPSLIQILSIGIVRDKEIMETMNKIIKADYDKFSTNKNMNTNTKLGKKRKFDLGVKLSY